jgi:uncharacterized protein (TIGR03435 family)
VRRIALDKEYHMCHSTDVTHKKLLLSLLICTLNAPRSHAQSFEVASVKPSGPVDAAHCSGDDVSPGRLKIQCDTVQDLIKGAYGVFKNGVPQPLQISGGPAWINSDHYDIEAKAEGGLRAEQMGPMIQSLLEDRFKLRVHREMRELPVYELTVAKSGLKLQPLKEACISRDPMSPPSPPAPGQKPPNFCGTPRMRLKRQNVTWDLHAASMTDFSAYLNFPARNLDRTVIDKTGVAGIFDFHLEFTPDGATPFFQGRGGPVPPTSADDPAGPSIFTALQELGLKLESAKGPVEFLVIDHVEKPSAN